MDLFEDMRLSFAEHLKLAGKEAVNRRRAITSYYSSLARSGQIRLLDYATAHDADLVGIFEEIALRRVAAFHERLMA